MMNTQQEYLIGDVISWKTGNIISKGIVRDDLNEEVEVVCFEVNGSPTRKRIKVKRGCIIKE